MRLLRTAEEMQVPLPMFAEHVHLVQHTLHALDRVHALLYNTCHLVDMAIHSCKAQITGGMYVASRSRQLDIGNRISAGTCHSSKPCSITKRCATQLLQYHAARKLRQRCDSKDRYTSATGNSCSAFARQQDRNSQ
eukprot:GHUV01043586.1.p1 GENE.GHUV01043586.1~~GHUV01043586.1.p1  ORF type:complete len:136 (-),score=12.02 GHUV01043586.1:19-426(-)